MWNEKNFKVIPAVVFLFCMLEIFELFLIINDMNQAEKLEKDLQSNLRASETIIGLLNERSRKHELEHFHDKKNGIK